MPRDDFGLIVDGGKSLSESELTALVSALDALAQFSRLEIVSNVAQKWGVTQTDLCERIDLTQPSISRHIDILLRAGILSVEINTLDGRQKQLVPNVAGIRSLFDGLGALLGVHADVFE